jgi:hypothetical protein
VQQYEREKDPLAQKRLLNKMMLPLIASQERKNIAAHYNCFDNQENSLLFFCITSKQCFGSGFMIRIQHFRILIGIWIQGFEDQKLERI